MSMSIMSMSICPHTCAAGGGYAHSSRAWTPVARLCQLRQAISALLVVGWLDVRNFLSQGDRTVHVRTTVR